MDFLVHSWIINSDHCCQFTSDADCHQTTLSHSSLQLRRKNWGTGPIAFIRSRGGSRAALMLSLMLKYGLIWRATRETIRGLVLWQVHKRWKWWNSLVQWLFPRLTWAADDVSQPGVLERVPFAFYICLKSKLASINIMMRKKQLPVSTHFVNLAVWTSGMHTTTEF